MTLRDQLARFIAENLLQDRDAVIDPDESLLDRGAIDSVGLLNLITHIETTTGVRIPDEEMVPENFETLTAIEGFIARLRGG